MYPVAPGTMIVSLDPWMEKEDQSQQNEIENDDIEQRRMNICARVYLSMSYRRRRCRALFASAWLDPSGPPSN